MKPRPQAARRGATVTAHRHPRRERVAWLVAVWLGAGWAPNVGAAEFDCVLEPRATVDLRSPVAGLIERIAADRGDFVKAGQLLVELDSGAERAALEVARHKATMEGALRSSESRLAYSSSKLSRREALASEDLMSIQDRDETLTEKKLAESELQEARDNLRQAALEVRRNEEALRLRALRSPVDGVVVERNMQPGELADPADSRRPILRIADITTLYAEAVLPADAYAQVKVGRRARVRVEIPRPISAVAVVKVVDLVLDAASGTFGVRLELPNPGGSIPAGVKCVADFPDLRPVASAPRRKPPP